MADIMDRTRAALEGHLDLDEGLLAASQAQFAGGTMRLASRIGGGVAGGALGMVVATAMTDADDLEARLANGLVIAVTDHRVVLLEVSAVSARPKAPVASIERSRIRGVTAGETRVMLVKLPTLALTLDDPDGPTLRFEIPKTARRDIDAVRVALGG